MSKHSRTARHARRRQEAPAALALAVTTRQVIQARTRLKEAFAAASGLAGLGQNEAAPTLAGALAALPDLRPLLTLAPELRAAVLSALVSAGAVVPRVTWERLGLAHAFDATRMRDAAAAWSLCATSEDIEGAGCYVHSELVFWPGSWGIEPLPRTAQTVVRARG